jgi:hypothetical protein
MSSLGEFPKEVYAFRADTTGRDGTFGTPLLDANEVADKVELYRDADGVERVRVARYQFVAEYTVPAERMIGLKPEGSDPWVGPSGRERL